MKKSFTKLALAAAISFSLTTAIAAKPDAKGFLETYSQIALRGYQDSVVDAKNMQKAIHAFVANPTEATFAAAKQSWLDAQDNYGTTEVYRFSEGPIDAEEGWVADAYGALEVEINSWPLDENMIDYTIDADGKRTSGNIIDSKGMFMPATLEAEPHAVNIDNITIDAITELNFNGGEANVASGYHAIEFLLWGQDQDYDNMIEDKITHGAMTAGQRPLSDYTSDKFAQRRKDYLIAAVDKLVADLQIVTSAWLEDVKGNDGLYRAALLGKLKKDDKNIAQNEALKQIFIGMGVFLKSELANERLAVAVLTPSEEDEHSCFSDNTHRDIATNYEGFRNLLYGTYHGKKIGVGLIDSLSDKDKKEVQALVYDIDSRISRINELATTVMHFDYQIHPENVEEVQNIVTLKNQMRKLADKMVVIGKAYGISLSEDDVTDPEETKV